MRNRTSPPRALILRRKVEIEITPARFTVFDSLRHLDVKRLSRAANARFEVGAFETDCCRRVVSARVSKGMVVRLEIERPDKELKVTGDLKRVLSAARRAWRSSSKSPARLPVPVSRFLARPLITIDVMFCIQICVFGWCLTCCIDTEDPLMNFCDLWDIPAAPPKP